MSKASNSGKRKMNEVQSPLPPVTNQLGQFSLNTGSRGNGNPLPSPCNFPPLPSGLRFASPSNLTPRPNGHRFSSPSNLTPVFNTHRFAYPNNLTPPVGQLFASPSNFVSPSNGRQHSQAGRILNAAAPTIRPYTFTSLLTADDREDPMVTEMRSQSEEVHQIITRNAKLLENAVGGMLEKQKKAIHDAADKQAAKKLKQKEAELQLKSAHNEDLERKAEHYKKEAETLSARVKYLEDYTKSLKLSMCHEDSSSSPPFIDPQNVGGAIIIECVVCDTQLASVMMLPCRHVSVCKRCNDVTKACPVCHKLKRASAEARIWPL